MLFRPVSKLTTGPAQFAFTGDSAGADTFILDPARYLITTGTGSEAVILAPTGAWKATINGTINSEQSIGLELVAGPTTKSSTIKVGSNGEVSGRFAGILLRESAKLTNAGFIGSPAFNAIEIEGAGTRTITNTGTIGSGGVASAIADTDGLSRDNLINSGFINGTAALGGGNDTVTNKGTMSAAGSGAPPALDLGDGTNKLTNSGTITAPVFGGSGADTLINTKTIDAFVDLGGGKNHITNSGIITGDLLTGSDVDIVTNFRTVHGKVISGKIEGLIDLGAGNDKFTGGNGAELLPDSNGSDTVKLGGGADTYTSFRAAVTADGNDHIDGGAGVDLYDASASTTKMFINLDSHAQHLPPEIGAGGNVGAHTAIFGELVGGPIDTITNFENVRGTSQSDVIYGSSGANVLEGGPGNVGDNLLGLGGNDTLRGEGGNDGLCGGAGADHLIGGAGNDQFQFIAVADSGTTAATRDVIEDFQHGDKIDLHVIEAINPDSPLQYININSNSTVAIEFTGIDQIRSYHTARGLMIEINLDNDLAPEMSIELLDSTHALAITIDDFGL